MSGYITNEGENFLLDLICGAQKPPADLWLALIVSEPSKYITGYEIDEPAITEYTRVRYSNQPGNWSERSGEMSNLDEIETVEVSGNEAWPTIGWWGLCDAQYGGRLLWTGAFDSPINLVAGDSITFPPGTIVIRTASYLSRTSII